MISTRDLLCPGRGEDHLLRAHGVLAPSPKNRFGASTDGSTLEDGSTCKIADFEDIVLTYLYRYVTVCVYKFHRWLFFEDTFGATSQEASDSLKKTPGILGAPDPRMASVLWRYLRWATPVPGNSTVIPQCSLTLMGGFWLMTWVWLVKDSWWMEHMMVWW